MPKKLEEYLQEVDYYSLNNDSVYQPTDFALKIINFLNAINEGKSEGNKTPNMHLAMLDKLASPEQMIVNLCSRGVGKSSLFMEILGFYCAVFNELPGLKDLNGMLYVSDSMENGAKTAKQSMEFRYNNSPTLRRLLPEAIFNQDQIIFKNAAGKPFQIKLYGAQSGIRGVRIYGKRPKLAVLDDLIKDADSRSALAMNAISETVYSGVMYALDPTERKVILNGTPFHKDDIICKAVESGAWAVNVWPICQKFPCKEWEFSSAWPDRFTYSYVKSAYDMAVANHKMKSFDHELMLRVTSDESRIVPKSCIRYKSKFDIMQNKGDYNFYITTDFATSSKQTADYSVISVWAYSAEGDWTWVDGICKRQLMNQTVDDVFKFVEQYQPQQVGIEVTGQQGGFGSWFRSAMVERDCYFNIREVRPTKDKLSRFQLVAPLFHQGRVFFAEEMVEEPALTIGLEQISYATQEGLKGKDDFIDTVSMLINLDSWKPVPAEVKQEKKIKSDVIWADLGSSFSVQADKVGLSSYLV